MRQETRYRAPRRSFALRFALFYLWAYSGGPREPFDALWTHLGGKPSPGHFGVCDTSLTAIYRALGVERPDDVGLAMWQRWIAREGSGGPHSP